MILRIYPQPIGLRNGHSAGDTILISDDWMFASFIWIAGAIAGAVTVKGLDLFENAAEKRILEALQDSAASISIRSEFVSVKSNQLQAFHFDLLNIPALYLPLIVLATQAEGTSVLSNIQTVIEKDEWLWLSCLKQLRQIGIELTIQDDLLVIKGGQQLKSNIIRDIQDGNLMMAVLLLSLKAEHPVDIHNGHFVDEQFPNAIEELNKMLIQKIEIIKE